VLHSFDEISHFFLPLTCWGKRMASAKRSLELDAQRLWEKYEEIAMHFNDLLMRIRMQSLAGITALSTLIGLFGGAASDDAFANWLIATALFGAMLFVWLAIFCLDYFYYSRLLNGAVAAILALEERTQQSLRIEQIDLSTHIDECVRFGSRQPAPLGVRQFYGVVFAFIFVASLICLRMVYVEQSKSETSNAAPAAQESPSL
jgi:purine-cytosine permease-like protein